MVILLVLLDRFAAAHMCLLLNFDLTPIQTCT